MINIEGSVGCTDLLLCQPITPVTSGCRNSVYLKLHFSALWRDYPERWAVFLSAKRKWSRARLDRDNVCTIPAEALAVHGTVYASVIGIRRTGETLSRVVTELAPITVARGGEVEADGA